MRDHNKLTAFHLAYNFVPVVYAATKSFPVEERFGLQSQLRRAAVSVPTNIVEGCARRTQPEYVQFLNIAYGSAAEVAFLIDLSHRLGLIATEQYNSISPKAEEVRKVLNGLVQSLT